MRKWCVLAASRLIVAVAVVLLSGISMPKPGLALDPPTGRVILEIDGEISEHNREGGIVAFDRAMLEALGIVTIVTETPWTEGKVAFEGVRVADLLAAVGARGTSMKAVAINDYAVDLPLSDFQDTGAILALKKDGDYMRIRDKGPLWLIYPWSDRPELKTEVYHARSIWQLKRLTIE